MTTADGPARKFLFAYPYARDQRDAVAGYIEDLRSGLAHQGLKSTALGLSDAQLRLERGPGGRLGRILNQVAFYAQLTVALLMAPKPVVVITVDAPSAIALVPQAIRRLSGNRVRDISWVMDLYRLRSNADPLHATERPSIRARWELRSLRGASKVVTIGECMRQVLATNGVTTAATVPLWTTQSKLEEGRFSGDGQLRLLYSGSARDIHPLRALLEAAEQLQATTQLRIAGRGSEIDAAAAFVRKSRLRNVVVSGLVADDEVRGEYAWADMHVVSLASVATGTCVPSKTYSAMGAGRAVFYIGDPSGQAAQDVLAARGGVVVPATRHSIKNQLEKLVRNPSEVSAMGSRAAVFAHQHRSRSTASMQWSAILQHWPT